MVAPTDLNGRYPFSTADGQAIPLDIIRPEGFVLIAFNGTPSTPFSLPDTTDCFSMKPTQDCILKFAASAASAAVPADRTLEADAIFLPKNTITIVSPPIGKRSISVIRFSLDGTLVVQYLQTWSGLALKGQFGNR